MALLFCSREYVEEKVVDFARQNPGIVVYVTPKKCRIPTVVAEYCEYEKCYILIEPDNSDNLLLETSLISKWIFLKIGLWQNRVLPALIRQLK